LIRHYTRPGEIVLDPFCGGGVTLVEGSLQQRRVIGFDINPLAVFVTRMELSGVDLDALAAVQERVCQTFRPVNDRLFGTFCRGCGARTPARWFEHAARVTCARCAQPFRIACARKRRAGNWDCPSCGQTTPFSPEAGTPFDIVAVSYRCARCGRQEVAAAAPADATFERRVASELVEAEREGLWVPDEPIPDCNMQRESALFKKGIVRFRQFFTPRHLLALARLRQTILEQRPEFREWLLLAFSSALRYANRMVTRNPSWRGDRPLEWAKPGFWLPPVHLEANVLEEFSRRCEAVCHGKRDYFAKLAGEPSRCLASAADALTQPAGSHVSSRSATDLPLPDCSVDAIITDPPYGSYVHYADLCNFWSVWLPEIEGLGGALNDAEEAVIARKRFPGAKTAADYRSLLERCFAECARVLKPRGYLVLTFHNREPRAWAALLLAATKAGFELPADGLLFQEGIPSYRHTAQSRRAGSVIGDFVLSFRKTSRRAAAGGRAGTGGAAVSEKEFLRTVASILRDGGPLSPDALMARLYLVWQPRLVRRVRAAVIAGDAAAEQLIADFDAIQLFDSHRRQLLEQHFCYHGGKWSLRKER